VKLVTFSHNNSPRPGILIDDRIINIPAAWPGPNPPRSLKQILQHAPASLARLAELADSTVPSIPLGNVRLLAPIPRPGKVLALAGNYAEHIKEAGLKLGLAESPRRTTVPRPFLMPSTVVIGPGDQIPWPSYSKTIDYEIELAVVIGKYAKNVQPQQAYDCIAGYTIANDVSARTVTFAENRAPRHWDDFYDWLNGKWADGFCPMGPYLLTSDSLPDPHNLDLTLTVNGHTRQQANTSQMIHTIPQVVSFLSHLMTLEPGDVITTGTPSGVALATGAYLKPGDRIDASIQNLGTLTNTLGPKPQQFYQPLK